MRPYLEAGAVALGGGAVLAAGAMSVAEDGHALSFSAGEVAVVTALLAAVTGALGLMFRTLQAEKEGRIQDQAQQIAHTQAQAQAAQEALANQIQQTVLLLEGVIADNRDAAGKAIAGLEEYQRREAEGRTMVQQGLRENLHEHQDLRVLITALAQAQGVSLGDARDPRIRQVREEARRLTSEGEREQEGA